MTILHLLDLVGVGVFAISGALAAGRNRLDLFGVVVIALVTAIGGGTIRDVLLDRHPIFWISNPAYLIVILAAAVLTIVWVRIRQPPLVALLVADALGLALFAISGAQIAENKALPALVVVMMGTITGVAGGMIRDVLTAQIPLVLRKGTLYASTAIGGIGVYLILQSLGSSRPTAAAIGMLTVVTLRFVSIAWGLSLPVFKIEGE
ncbi:MAG TPA: trimeric intracellular cation channel family protein [Gemmatimonadaceae bacterium]|nr:trimeric intracellular cation channel family protein [Gemmatimonadaceae bacterium]